MIFFLKYRNHITTNHAHWVLQGHSIRCCMQNSIFFFTGGEVLPMSTAPSSIGHPFESRVVGSMRDQPNEGVMRLRGGKCQSNRLPPKTRAALAQFEGERKYEEGHIFNIGHRLGTGLAWLQVSFLIPPFISPLLPH